MKTLTAFATALALLGFAGAAAAMCGSQTSTTASNQQSDDAPILLPKDKAAS